MHVGNVLLSSMPGEAYPQIPLAVRDALKDRVHSKVAEATGLHVNTVRNVAKNTTQRFSLATIEKLEQYILPPLLDGRGDAFTLANGTAFVCPALALLGRTDESIRILLRSVEVGIPPSSVRGSTASRSRPPYPLPWCGGSTPSVASVASAEADGVSTWAHWP